MVLISSERSDAPQLARIGTTSDSRGTKGCAVGVPKQDRWITNLHRAMLLAIGQQLKAEHDVPNELTPEHVALLSAIDIQKDKLE
jgi:hypothetical protein